MTYAELLALANRIARVLTDDCGLVPGNRVLLRSANSPMLAALTLAVIKAGGVVVATMPLLRAGELVKIIDKARIGLALCDERLREEMDGAVARAALPVRVVTWAGAGGGELGALLEGLPDRFESVDTRADEGHEDLRGLRILRGDPLLHRVVHAQHQRLLRALRGQRRQRR